MVYVAFQGPFRQHSLLNKFDYNLKITVFECRLRLKSRNLLFELAFTGLFRFPTVWCHEFFILVTERWDCDEAHRLLYAPTPIVFAYYSNLVLLGERNDLVFCVDVVEHSGLSVMAFATFAAFRGYCTASRDFCGVEDLHKGDIILLLSHGILH